MDQKQFTLSPAHLNTMRHDDHNVWIVRDLNQRFVYTNYKHHREVGLPESYDISGRDIIDPPCPCYQDCGDEFKSYDVECIRTAQPIRNIAIHPNNRQGWYVHFYSTSPYYNEHDSITGCILQGRPLSDEWMKLNHAIRNAMRQDTRSNQHFDLKISNFPNLSTRESEVVFLLMCNRKPKEVAHVLNISENSVRTHIDRLKTKFNVHSYRDVIDVAFSMGLDKFIVPSIFQQHLTVFLD
ncbi:helix-turn-helix transcriptional regulator [Endozoicomonadaceae bacterium StTr2]